MKKLVVLTGAGISAESGLRTFRDGDGLWEGFDVSVVASIDGWRNDPALVLDFYNARRRNVLAASPNAAHVALADLEKDFDVTIITQNIDDLHERGGSSRVIHLHGEILKMRSEKNGRDRFDIRGDILPGQLAADGAQLRPDIVWFGEEVPLLGYAAQCVTKADIFAVIGTSLVVYPAASLVDFAPREIPKYLIDKKIPEVSNISNLITIEHPATLGTGILAAALRKV